MKTRSCLCGGVAFELQGDLRASGTIDGASGITTAKHIFVADKGDYYDIADDVPQHDT